MKLPILIVILFIFQFSANAKTFYVRTDGNDNNQGTVNSEAGAWQTLNHAFNQLSGGDTLLINDGLFLVQPIELVEIHGTPEAPTVIAAINQWEAKIRLKENPEEGNTLVAFTCSYLEIDGLEVYGEAPNRGTGIEIAKGSHHVTIRNCYVHDCGCGGISGRGSDYITVERNVVRHNATRSKWNCSGISFLLAENFDDKPGYHMIIRNNVSFENECRFPFEHGGFDVPTDGNGIILDLFNNGINSTEEGEKGGYRSATLIENNLSFNNGGRGINVFRSDNVTIRNNTTWHNLFVLSEYSDDKAEVETYEAKNTQWYNNLIIQNEDLPVRATSFHVYGDEGVETANNIFVGESHFWPNAPEKTKDKVLNKSEQKFAKLKKPTKNIKFKSVDDFEKYFGLKKGSPAIDEVINNYPNNDLNRNSRKMGKAADIGCYEYNGK